MSGAHGRRAFFVRSTVVAFWGAAFRSARISSSLSCLHAVLEGCQPSVCFSSGASRLQLPGRPSLTAVFGMRLL